MKEKVDKKDKEKNENTAKTVKDKNIRKNAKSKNIAENKKNTNILILVFRIVSLFIILICLIAIIIWQIDNIKNNSLQSELADYSVLANSSESTSVVDSDGNSTDLPIQNLTVDFESLKSRNSNVVAWIYVPNTNINFPIVQGNDNTYYLNHNFDNKRSSAGWIFAESTNSFNTLDQNTIIYGHNRRNGSMFSNLTYLLDSSWYDDETNKYFNFVTEEKSYIAEIFSVYKVEYGEANLTINFASTSEFYDTVDSWIDQSIYDFGVSVDNPHDNIITLYTCNNNTKYRIIVHARLLSIK